MGKLVADIAVVDEPTLPNFAGASARAAISLWTHLAVMPAEILFDAIEAELERRGVEPDA
jgi:hypothetical protein